MNTKTIENVQIETKSHTAFKESIVIAFWSLSVWLVVLNTTMFNVALPTVTQEFTLTPTVSSWIVTGYSIVFAIATITYSRLSDYVPLRRLVMLGATLLGISSIIGFFAHSFSLLLLARLLQAIGASVFPGLGVVLATRYIPVERRGRSMSSISSAAALGFGLGPVIGGFLTQYLGWNYLFIVTACVLFIVPLFHKFLPQETGKKARFDLWGALLMGVGVTGLLLFLTTFSPLSLVVGAGSILLFWRHVNRTEIPFIYPELLRHKQYTKLLLIGFAAFFINFANLFLMPILLSGLFHQNSSEIGMIIFPGAIVAALLSNPIGRMIDKTGNAVVMRSALFLFSLSIVCFVFVAGISPYFNLVSYLFMSIGFTSLTSSVMNEISRILPMQQIGSGMGIAQLINFFGGAFGVGVTSMLLVFQNSLTPAQSYQNIYIGMFLLIMTAFFTFTRYKKA